MITCKSVRELALSLPEAEEKDHWGRPSFRVKNKIFATLWQDEQRAVLKLSLLDQSAVIASNPKAFSLAQWEHQGWTNVYLAHVDPTQFRLLLVSAWRNVAPKKIVNAFDSEK